MHILQRYILRELSRVFLMALVGFTSIFVMGVVVKEANDQGLNPVQILCLIPLAVPTTLPYAVPATLLLAVTIVYGRLSADNEVMAVKSAGIKPLKLVTPALALGFVMSLVTLYLFDRVIPAANFHMRSVFVNNVEDLIYSMLKREQMIRGGGLPYEIYVQDVQGKTLIEPIFKRRNPDGGYDVVVHAKRATLEFDLPHQVVNVRMYQAYMTDGKGNNLTFKEEELFPIMLPKLRGDSKSARDLSIQQIHQRERELVSNQERNTMLWAFNSSTSLAGGHFKQVPWGSLVELVERQKNLNRELKRLECEPYMRWAISFGCLSFVLLGCPVAILFQRGDYLTAFISCFLPIIVLYYPLVMFGFNLSKEGKLPPGIMWVGNGILLLLALVAFRPVLRH